MFVHLRTHSCYSFLTGLPKPAELAQTAARLEMPALALTDRRSLTGAIEFYDACRAAGIQPVMGLELCVSPPANLSQALTQASPSSGSLVLLVENAAGWANVCALSSRLHQESETAEDSFLSWQVLEEHSAGLVCLSGGASGWATQWLQQGQQRASEAFLSHLEAVFPDRLYIEIQRQRPDDASWSDPLRSLARKLGLPVVATQEVYYLKPEEAALQRLLTSIRLNQPLANLPDNVCAPPEAFFTSPQQMAEAFADLPEALAATGEVAERCRFDLPLGKPHFPEIPLPPGQTALDVLRQKAKEGAIRLYGEVNPSLRARLDHELSVISQQGYASLFLIVEEILAYANRTGVPLSSRGSAASSLVAHCLGLTSPDPIRLNLYFERFLNPARLTPPDIDTDLCSRRRDSVIHYVYQRFGADRAAMVCTINRFRRRSALREAAKANGLSPSQVKALVERLPSGWGAPWREQSQEDPYADLKPYFPQPLYEEIFAGAAALIGRPRHLSIHPGGMVISPGPLTELAPTLMAAKGVLITQFDLESIERLGLVKIDLLGIRGLTVLGDVAEAIVASRPEAYTAPLDPLEQIPEQDPAVSDLLQNGRTIGCFQIESPGMRFTLKEIQARSIDDLMVALALYRPGPLTGGLKNSFVRRHRGQEQVSHLHPALATLLADTYGVILYQEQVLRIAHELAGLSLAEADLLRRAMSHFDPGEQMKTLRMRFISGAIEKGHVPEAVAERIWELMAAFAGYGFPKAHAASYALVAWRAAWCKVHHPALFMAAVLANWGGYYGQRVYLTEARRLGLAIRPPHINHAGDEFCVQYMDGSPVLFMGLSQVRELTRRTQARILHSRPFHSLPDFLARVDPRSQEAENLIRCGALEGLGSIPALLDQLKGGWRKGQLPLFSLDSAGEPDWTLEEKVTAQEEILGMGVDAHPLELVADQISTAGAHSTVEAAALSGQTVRLAGMRQSWVRSRTLHGEPVYSMTLEDLEGMVEVIISSPVYARSRSALSTPGPYLLEGRLETSPATGEPIVYAQSVWPIERK